jgi:hypothetical protein
MGTLILTIFLGVVLAIPLIYLLDLESPGGITLLIFLCTGTVGIFSGFAKFISKKKKRRQSNEDQSIGS